MKISYYIAISGINIPINIKLEEEEEAGTSGRLNSNCLIANPCCNCLLDLLDLQKRFFLLTWLVVFGFK